MKNFTIHELPTIKYMVVNKSEETTKQITGILLIGITKLDNGEIDMLLINDIPFTRKSFEFKNGKFNTSKAVDLTTWSYHKDIMKELINYKYEETI